MDKYKHPNRGLYKLIKESFDMTDEDFRAPHDMGLEEISFQMPSTLSPQNSKAVRRLQEALSACGEESLSI